MSEHGLDPQDITNLISKLKDSTPDYPGDLMAARKAAFLQEAVAIQIHVRGMSGKGGGDGGASGSGTLGGMTSAQTILLQAVIGVWVIAAMLTAAYVFRDQIIDLLRDNGIVPVEMTLAPSSEPLIPATIAPSPVASPTEVTPLAETPVPGADPGIQMAPTDSKDNPGLHLGQTPGSPDTPNQDKPDKPDKPTKNPNKK